MNKDKIHKEQSLSKLFKIFLIPGISIVTLNFLGVIVASGFQLAPPIIQQIFTDDIITHKNPDWFWPTMLVYALFIIIVISTWIGVTCSKRFKRAKYMAEINSNYIWHVMRMPMQKLLSFTPGDLITRVSRSEYALTKILDDVLPVVCNIFLIIVAFVVMYTFCWQLATVVLFCNLLSLIAIVTTTKSLKRMSKTMESDQREVQGKTMTILKNIETVKSLGAEYGVYRTWHNNYVNSLNSRIKINRSMITKEIIPLMCDILGSAVVLILGCRYILDGLITPGVLLAFQAFMVVSLKPLVIITNAIQTLFTAVTALEAVQVVQEIECSVPDNLTDEIPENIGKAKLTGEIELKHVTFGYNRENGALLHDFSMKVKPGESIAFVGLSGCGKSTVAKLITGLYEPWEGEVLFDGKPYREIPRMVFTNSVSVINQDIVLFEGTVADNIKMWDDSIDENTMTESAARAQIHEIITERSGAYNSEVTDNGKNFSGGQRQRLEIATALAKDPTILIMDEATSALDNETERKVMKSIQAMGITVIMIAHRLSTVRNCDQIFVMEYGHVLQHGRHEELMKDTNGLYYKLNS